jgi:hypothetical protein
VAVLVRKLCAGIDLLPPLSIHQDVDHDSARSSLLLTFAKASDFDLPRHLIIRLDVSLEDAATPSVDIAASALVSPDHVRPDATATTALFQGAFEDAVVETHLERLLLTAIDEAQRLGEGDRTPLPLTMD